MTELERELTATLRAQEQIFREELQKVTRSYEVRMSKALAIIEKQNETIERQNETIEKQNKTLEKYASVSNNLRIELDQGSLNNLTKRLNDLETLVSELVSEEENLSEELDEISMTLDRIFE
jgi:chaperonin cofactor prefoldin